MLQFLKGAGWPQSLGGISHFSLKVKMLHAFYQRRSVYCHLLLTSLQAELRCVLMYPQKFEPCKQMDLAKFLFAQPSQSQGLLRLVRDNLFVWDGTDDFAKAQAFGGLALECAQKPDSILGLFNESLAKSNGSCIYCSSTWAINSQFAVCTVIPFLFTISSWLYEDQRGLKFYSTLYVYCII